MCSEANLIKAIDQLKFMPSDSRLCPVDNNKKKMSRILLTMQFFINKAGNMVQETLEIDLLKRRSLCFIEETSGR